MAEENVKRKLTAILYADVAGYSRLTGEDEVGTHQQLSAGLDLISNEIEGKGGKVVHYAGDAVLADFSSVVAAVDCAVGIQRQLSDGDVADPAISLPGAVRLGVVGEPGLRHLDVVDAPPGRVRRLVGDVLEAQQHALPGVAAQVDLLAHQPLDAPV